MPADPLAVQHVGDDLTTQVLDELVVHNADIPDQLLRCQPADRGDRHVTPVLAMQDPLNLAALEYSPYDQSYTIDIALGDHVYGLDFGNEIQPDEFEDNESIAEATDLGTVVHTEIDHLSIAGTAFTCTVDDIRILDQNGFVIFQGQAAVDASITLQDLIDGYSIIICDKLFDEFALSANDDGEPMAGELSVTPLPDDPLTADFDPGLGYTSGALQAVAGESVDLEFEYTVSVIGGQPLIKDASVLLTSFGVNPGGLVSVSDAFPFGNLLAQADENSGFDPNFSPEIFDSIDFAPVSSLRVRKDIAIDGPAQLSGFQQRYSQDPPPKRPDWDYFKVTSWATGSFEFTLDQQAGYIAAEVIQRRGRSGRQRRRAPRCCSRTTSSRPICPVGRRTQSGIPLADDWFLTTQRGNEGGHSAENSYHIGPEGSCSSVLPWMVPAVSAKPIGRP